jgi:hypothetical protein
LEARAAGEHLAVGGRSPYAPLTGGGLASPSGSTCTHTETQSPRINPHADPPNLHPPAPQSEDSRARHFRFRKQRTEISWSQLNAADADRLVASLDVGLLEGLLPNLTYGSITNEDDEQLTPHHFNQLVPLAQVRGAERGRAGFGRHIDA